MANKRDIKYVNRDFDSFLTAIKNYATTYFPDTYTNFISDEPGSLFIELAAAVGDVLSFYQDIQVQETYLQYASETQNLFNLAYLSGYRPKVTTSSTVKIDIRQRVPSILSASVYVPNYNYAINIESPLQLAADTNSRQNFIVDRPINFAYSSSIEPTEVTIYSVDGSGNPLEYTLKKTVTARSGEINTITQTVTTPQRFYTFTIDDDNIIGILDITDSDDNIWYEVPFLAQETVFTEQANTQSDKVTVPQTLNLQKTPRRFVSRFNSDGQLIVQFGAGVASQDDEIITPNPENVGLGNSNGISRIDYAYDPSNFLYTQTYGLAPSNTTLTVRYLTGGGIQSNVPANLITTPTTFTYTFNGTTTPAVEASVADTITFNNPEAATGGKDGDTAEEIRQNSLRSYGEQKRAVTKEDYIVRALSMPSRLGTVSKAYIVQDQLTSTKSITDNIIDSNPLSLSLYILSYDSNRNLIPATNTLKSNLQTYLEEYRLLTDAINIKDAFIINIGIEYDIIVLPGFNARDVLTACTQRLQERLDIRNMQINQPINLAELYVLLDKVKGVQTVQHINIVNKAGGIYSQYGYDTKGAIINNVLYPSLDPSIFEIKFPNTDIVGRTVTL